jgi:hypothetical protein
MSASDHELAAWRSLLEDDDLVAAAAAVDAADVAAVERLRRGRDAAAVSAALALAEGRRRLRRKFPDGPRRWDTIWTDREGAEQASSAVVADWKARRFADASGTIVDLCCGIGGDAMSLARVGEVVAVDRAPLRAWMASRNAGCPTLVADIVERRPPGRWAHIDPARREERGRGRLRDPAAYEPSLATCVAIALAHDGAAIKLGPGVEHELPELRGCELECVADAGTLVQAVAWTGSLARRPGERRATTLPAGLTVVGPPSVARTCADGRFGAWIFVPDPALERARLVGLVADPLGLRERSPGLGILTSDHAVESGWFSAFEVLARPRPREREVLAALRDAGASGARVRTRGGAVDADRWTKALRTDESGAELDVFLLRCGDRLEAIVARPRSE